MSLTSQFHSLNNSPKQEDCNGARTMRLQQSSTHAALIAFPSPVKPPHFFGQHHLPLHLYDTCVTRSAAGLAPHAHTRMCSKPIVASARVLCVLFK